MKTVTEKLADALRAVLPFAERDVGELTKLANDGDSESEAMAANADVERAAQTLAEYEAERALQLPTPYRVTWEIDAFNAETPREAAEEAREAMTRAGTTATCLTVYGADGTVTEVDLSEEG